jgi:hypothetical protein
MPATTETPAHQSERRPAARLQTEEREALSLMARARKQIPSIALLAGMGGIGTSVASIKQQGVDAERMAQLEHVRDEHTRQLENLRADFGTLRLESKVDLAVLKHDVSDISSSMHRIEAKLDERAPTRR